MAKCKIGWYLTNDNMEIVNEGNIGVFDRELSKDFLDEDGEMDPYETYETMENLLPQIKETINPDDFDQKSYTFIYFESIEHNGIEYDDFLSLGSDAGRLYFNSDNNFELEIA